MNGGENVDPQHLLSEPVRFEARDALSVTDRRHGDMRFPNFPLNAR